MMIDTADFIKIPPLSSCDGKVPKLGNSLASHGAIYMEPNQKALSKHRIDVALVDTVPLGVDTPADLKRARELFQSRR